MNVFHDRLHQSGTATLSLMLRKDNYILYIENQRSITYNSAHPNALALFFNTNGK